MTDSVAIRLTPAQMSVIWPGLDFIVKAELKRRKSGTSPYCYPFSVYPPPGGFDRGTHHPAMMDLAIHLWKKLRGKQNRGGRVHLDSLEIRCAIFAVRVTGSLGRMRTRDFRKKIAQQKALMKQGYGPIDARLRQQLAAMKMTEESYLALLERVGLEREREANQLRDRHRRHSRRTIDSLERHMKRANRRLLTDVGKTDYAAIVRNWQRHVRWMRLHLVYFKPWPPLVRKKRRQQLVLDVLTEIAIRGFEYHRDPPPEPRELRRILRLYVRSSNRGREGRNSVPEILEYPNHFDSAWFLARWVSSRVRVEGRP